jgi:hypothetical protein
MTLVAVACAALLTACGGQSSSEPSSSASVPAAFADREASGEDLANAWFGLLSLTGREAGDAAETPEEVAASKQLVQPYLDPAFTLVRANGQRYTAGTYVPLDVDAFEVSDVVVTEPRDDIRVLRYFVTEPGATAPDSGVVMGDGKAPRISVFRWDEERGHWVLVSHANFNSPVAAICERSPIVVSGESPATSPEDIELGTSLVEQWRAITMGESTEKIRHPANQIQLADGQGWPTADGKPIEWAPASAYEAANVGIARNGDLLVASYDAVVSDIVMEGDEYAETASPRLLTYLLSPEGTWELIALANFSVPQGIPADVDCVSLGS